MKPHVISSFSGELAFGLVVAVICALIPGRAWASSGDGLRPGSISGIVTSEITRQPVQGAAVTIEGSDVAVETNEGGRFAIAAIPPGEYRVHVSREGHLPALLTDVVVTAGRDTQTRVRLQETVALTDEVAVEATSFERASETPTGSFGMTYEEVRRAPGALQDVSRMIQALPGLSPRDDQRNDIVARGGSPAENLTIVDGVEVPNLNHFGAQGTSGGPVTMLNAELVSDVSFLAGGHPAPYGDRLSSVLDVSLREGNRDKTELEFDLSMAGAGLIAEGPLGKKGSWLVSGRRSYIDLIAGPYGLTTIPEYANYLGKVVYDLSPRNTLTLMSLGGMDKIYFDVDPTDLEDANTAIVDHRGWRTATGLVWRSLLGESGVATTSAAYSQNHFGTDAWETLLDDALVQHNRSQENALTFKTDLSYRLPTGTQLRLGGLARWHDATFEIDVPLGTDNVFAPEPARINPLTLDETVRAWQTGAFLPASQPVSRWVTLTAGARYDRFILSGAEEISPRGSLTLHAHRTLDISASYGRYYQSPTLVLMTTVPQNSGLRPIQAAHYVAGLSWFPRGDLRVTVEGYRKEYDRYPVSTQFPSITMADTGGQYEISYLLMPVTSEGQGRATGVEAYIQKRLSGRLWGQLSYAYSRTRHRALDGVWRPGGFDLPHVLSAVAGVKNVLGFDMSAQFVYTSGSPITPLHSESVVQNRLIYDLTRTNEERAPEYHTLNLRLDRRESHRWGNLTWYVEADNVYNRKNVRGYEWNPKTRQAEPYAQLSLMVIGGINVEF